MKAAGLEVGDHVRLDDDTVQRIRHIGNGMTKGRICLTYVDGRFSEVEPADEVEIEEPGR